jgi:CTP:molybdopterin cytidylyltransferase MocA
MGATLAGRRRSLTVAAIVLVPDPAAALAEADGEAVITRLIHTAWAGGALPVVVVVPDGDATLAGAIAELPGVVANAPAGVMPGAAWFVFGMRAAMSAVTETTAALLWPFRYAWVDPETITSLVEAHGATPDEMLRPAFGGLPGFPVLVPISLEARLDTSPGVHGREAVERLAAEGVPLRLIELGDPGIIHDLSTPRAEMPDYQGPPEPAAGPPPEWNADLAANVEGSAERAV